MSKSTDMDDKADYYPGAETHVLPAGEEMPADAPYDTKNPHRGLLMRHLQLIAIAGSIGSGVFVSIGDPLTACGPLGLLLGVIIWASVVIAIAQGTQEITCLLPEDGGFIRHCTRFVSNSVGMALGWNYLITQLALICYELTALNVLIEYWSPNLNPAIMISVGLVFIFCTNMYSVRSYGEAEYWLSVTKIILAIGLAFFTFITMVGGNPLHDKFGFRFWKTPGAFSYPDATNRAMSIWDAICWSTFAIVGPDYLSLVSGSVKNPRKVMPKAFKAISTRITAFYVIGALCVGILVPFDDENLLGAIAAGAPGSAQSPYIIAMNRLQIKVLPDIVNAFVLLSVFSTLNSFLYAASYCMLGLAEQGQTPKVFLKLNRHGTPWVCVLFCWVFGFLAYLSVSAGTVKVLNWWIYLVTCAQLITWSLMALTYLRFRAGLKAQGLLDTDILPSKSYWQPWPAWYAMVWGPFSLVFSGYYIFAPGAFDPVDFIFAYGSIFIFLFLLVCWKIRNFYYKVEGWGWVKAEDMDFVTGVAEIETMTEAYEAEEAQTPKTRYEKIMDFFF